MSLLTVLTPLPNILFTPSIYLRPPLNSQIHLTLKTQSSLLRYFYLYNALPQITSEEHELNNFCSFASVELNGFPRASSSFGVGEQEARAAFGLSRPVA